MSDELWAGTDASPLSPTNPFNPDTEEHAAWERQVNAEAEAARQIHNAQRLAAETDQQLLRMRARAAAADQLRAEQAATLTMPEVIDLKRLLLEEDEPVRYRIDQLWPIGGRVILAAGAKAGKTTLRDNLVRCLADETPFLGSYQIAPIAGTIILFDTELSRNMLRRWLRAQNIHATSRIVVVPMRGQAGTFDLREASVCTRWADIIRDHDGQIVILDCLAPILIALGIDPNKEAGQFLDAGMDPLLTQSGATEALITHHMGHVAERSRGDSRLRDWPDVEWRLLREKEDDEHEADPMAPRYFAAYGRDVELGEQRLMYEPAEREIIVVGGNRRDRLIDLVVDAVRASPGMNVSALCKQIAVQKAKVLEAKDRAIRVRLIRVQNGPNNRQFLYPSDPVVPDGSDDAEPPKARWFPNDQNHTNPQVNATISRSRDNNKITEKRGYTTENHLPVGGASPPGKSTTPPTGKIAPRDQQPEPLGPLPDWVADAYDREG